MREAACGAASATVLVVCPSHRDRRELARLPDASRHHLLFHDYASIELEEMVAPSPRNVATGPVHDEVERLVETAASAGVDGVISTDDYPGTTLAAIVAHRLGLPGTSAAADLRCQHKYQSRLIQQSAQPDAVPPFALLDSGVVPELPFPFFIKPVKSFFSVGAYRVDDLEALQSLIPLATLPQQFFAPFASLLEHYAGVAFGHSKVLAEGLLVGRQATFEGYAFKGRVHPLGVVDSVMFQGTSSFERFEYPSVLPEAVQDRMAEMAVRVMEALAFTHGLFNIEFLYDPQQDRLGIVEINPRMASQFADLYEKVDGFNSYALLLDLALGRQPLIHRAAGRHAVAASCVLRRFEDALVVRVPAEDDLRRISEMHPDVRIEVLASTGERLSRQLQDGCSFRYGIVSLGGHSRQDLLQALDWCRRRLPFRFELSPPPSRCRSARTTAGSALPTWWAETGARSCPSEPGAQALRRDFLSCPR